MLLWKKLILPFYLLQWVKSRTDLLFSFWEWETRKSKLAKCYTGKSVAHSFTILLLSVYPKGVAASTQAFTTINKSSVMEAPRVISLINFWNIYRSILTKSKKTVHEMEAHWLTGKERVPDASASKDFLEKGLIVNSAYRYHFLRQNSPHLLNNPRIWIYNFTIFS